MNKIKFNFSVKKILSIFLKYKYLLFLIFFGAYLGFVLNISYKYAYVNTKFIEYRYLSESRLTLSMRKSKQLLKEILANIEKRDERFEAKKYMEYNSPFEFREASIPKDKKLNILNSEPKNNLIYPSKIRVKNNVTNDGSF